MIEVEKNKIKSYLIKKAQKTNLVNSFKIKKGIRIKFKHYLMNSFSSTTIKCMTLVKI